MASAEPLGSSRRSVRKSLLRQAVEDNVHTIEGRPRERPRAIIVRRTRIWTLLLVGGLAVAGSYYLPRALGLGGPEQRAPLLSPTPRLGSAPDARDVPEGSVRITTLAALDSAVFPVGVRRVVLDPGHGGRDSGSTIPGGLTEKELTLDIARRLQGLLHERTAIEVLLTREDDRQVVLKDRALYANRVAADLFVSIHLNWLEPRSISGVETFFLGPTDDPYLVELTSRENRESGYSLADVRSLLDGIYTDVRQDQSHRLARSIQRSLFGSLQPASAGLRDRGAKPAPFLVLVATEMPAILAEVSCLSNPAEAERLAGEEYRQRIAEALFEGVEKYAKGLSHS